MPIASSVESIRPSHHKQVAPGTRKWVTAWIWPMSPSGLTGDLDAGLGGGDETLVDDRVHPVPGGVGVGGEEDPVT
jgi:hypothetical protein